MTDRELLEAAARAAGNGAVWYAGLGMGIDTGAAFPRLWNPLADDGDTLRLEVALKFTAAWEPMRGGWSIGGIVGGEFRWLAFNEDRKRATVSAAAIAAGSTKT